MTTYHQGTRCSHQRTLRAPFEHLFPLPGRPFLSFSKGFDHARNRRLTTWTTVVGVALLAGCGGAKPAPGPGESLGVVPDLRGTKVMVFPLQSAQGFDRLAFDPEFTSALDRMGNGIDWVLPDDLRRIRSRTPGLDMQVDNLPVGVFLQTEVRRIGDPLYGYLRRMGAVADSDVALVPVGAGGADTAIEVAATLIDARSGRVIWYGVVEGEGQSASDSAGLTAAAEALARTLAPYGTREGL